MVKCELYLQADRIKEGKKKGMYAQVQCDFGLSLCRSMITLYNHKEYRYTVWVGFNGKVPNGPDWTDVVGVEL